MIYANKIVAEYLVSCSSSLSNIILRVHQNKNLLLDIANNVALAKLYAMNTEERSSEEFT